jgi:hypothetical protein
LQGTFHVLIKREGREGRASERSRPGRTPPSGGARRR